jgi:hypothetical protein
VIEQKSRSSSASSDTDTDMALGTFVSLFFILFFILFLSGVQTHHECMWITFKEILKQHAGDSKYNIDSHLGKRDVSVIVIACSLELFSVYQDSIFHKMEHLLIEWWEENAV